MSGGPGVALKDQFPMRLIVGSEDLTFLLDESYSFSSVDPGGFEAASFSVPKDLPETLRGTYVRLDCGLKVAFEGRISQVQRSLGSRTQLSCEGLGALFKDDAGSMVFVDRDLTRWQSPSYTRQIALADDNYQLASSSVAADPTSNSPALAEVITDSWVSPYVPLCEAWYDSGPENLISAIYYAVDFQGSRAQATRTAAIGRRTFSCPRTRTRAPSKDLRAAAGPPRPRVRAFEPATPYRFAFVQLLV